jgi:hypothetical protein
MEPAAGDRANKQNANFAELLAEALLSTYSTPSSRPTATASSGSGILVPREYSGILAAMRLGARLI